MRLIFTFLFVAAFTVASFGQTITWTTVQLAGGTDVLNDGELVEALNFAGGDDVSLENTTLNGVDFVGLVSGAASGNAFANPSSDHFDCTSQNVVPATVDQYKLEADADDAHFDGLEVFNVMMSRFLWNQSGESTITLKGLVAGTTYKVQLFMGDTRVSQDSSYIVINPNDDFSGGDYGSIETTEFANSNGITMIGEFTATEETLSFVSAKVLKGTGGTHLNAYQLRKYGNTSSDRINESKMKVFFSSENQLRIENTKGDVRLYNLAGKLVKQTIVNGSENISTADLNSGVYIVKSGIQVEKVLIY